MGNSKPPSPSTPPSLISGSTWDWLQQFLKHFESNLVDQAGGLVDASDAALRQAVIQAVLVTLVDSGADWETAKQEVASALVLAMTSHAYWTPELNARRFALIDRRIQGTITVQEQMELSDLTNLMRQFVDQEENLQFDGARELHRKLLMIGPLGEQP